MVPDVFVTVDEVTLGRDELMLLLVTVVPALTLAFRLIGWWFGCRGRRTKVAGAYEDDDVDDRTQRVVCSRAVSNFSLGACGISLRYAYLSQRGHYPDDLEKANQDCFTVIERFNDQPDQMFLGVFDGHGEYGDDCSRFVRDEIHGELISQIRFDPVCARATQARHAGAPRRRINHAQTHRALISA